MIIISKNKRLLLIVLAVPLLLLIPLIGRQFTAEVNWSGFDYIIMGVLLLGAGLLLEMVLRKVRTRISRIILVVMILVLFLMIWAELAVGIFGTPFAGS